MKNIIFLLLVAWQVPMLHAQEFVITKPEKISAIDSFDMFGWHVSQNKDYIFIASPFENAERENTGAIYIYKKDPVGYHFQQHLTLLADAVNEKFGSVIAHSDQYLLTTTQYSVETDKGIGNIHLFMLNDGTWTLTQSFEIDVDNSNVPPPSSMAVSGNTIVLGVPAKSQQYPNGFISVYSINPTTNTATESQRISPEGLNTYDKVGYQVAVENDILAFSSLSANGINKNSGVVWLYQLVDDNWQLLTKLNQAEANTHEKFGSSISIHYPYIAIGAMRQTDNSNQKKCGAVYVYRMVGMKPSLDAILGPDIAANHYDYFGSSISLADDVLAVGANSDDNAGINTGAVYIFKREDNEWKQVDKLIGSGVNDNALFGSSISVYGNDVVCSSHLEEKDSTKRDHGVVYLFRNAASPDNENNLEDNYVTLYPNPISDYVTLYINDESVKKITVFDISGRALAEVWGDSTAVKTVNNSLVYTFDCQRWSSGNLIFSVAGKRGITNIKAIKLTQ